MILMCLRHFVHEDNLPSGSYSAVIESVEERTELTVEGLEGSQ